MLGGDRDSRVLVARREKPDRLRALSPRVPEKASAAIQADQADVRRRLGRLTRSPPGRHLGQPGQLRTSRPRLPLDQRRAVLVAVPERVVVHPALQPERPTFDPDAWRCAGGRGAWPDGAQPPSRKSGSENAACRWAGDLRLRAFEAVAVVPEDPSMGDRAGDRALCIGLGPGCRPGRGDRRAAGAAGGSGGARPARPPRRAPGRPTAAGSRGPTTAGGAAEDNVDRPGRPDG